ncbi:hypothetical protein [Bradyrhizobium sp. USDA 4452]
MTTIYRNYDVSKVGDTFVGQSRDDESLMISRSQQRLMSAIDQMWDGLDRGSAPSWFSGSSAIDLDAVEIVDQKDAPEAIASETDPPPAGEWRVPYWLFGLAALSVSAPVAYAMDFLRIDARNRRYAHSRDLRGRARVRAGLRIDVCRDLRIHRQLLCR